MSLISHHPKGSGFYAPFFIKKDREKYISLSRISAITITHSLQPEKPLQKFRHTIMIIISGHLISSILYILFGIAHGNTDTCSLQHFQIILIISESDQALCEAWQVQRLCPRLLR